MKNLYIIIISLLSIVLLVLLYSFVYRIFISPPVKPEIEVQVNEKTKILTIQIEVLNGTNVNGLAKKMTTYLRQQKFDVLNFGNWKNDSVKYSMIYDRLGEMTASRNVAEAIGLSDSLIFSRPDSSLILNTTVIIGNDYKKLKPFK